jgi:NAD(P)-dependent dehydrogenase (short-subunit alcohol dehydrogenase family)
MKEGVKERFMHFKDEVAIVTGGSSGIGKETARRLVAHGASVLIGGRDEAKLQSAAAEIGAPSGKVRVLARDISSPATGAALVESAERHFGGLDKFDSGARWSSFTTQGGGR